MTERNMQLEDWLDDLCVRFIMNLPIADQSDAARICFHIEEAQWFYEDFIRPLDPALPSMNLRRFSEQMFAHCPLLVESYHSKQHMLAFENFLAYKNRVPVRGAIMLNDAMDAAVLVKGWKKGANWSFPRGKQNMEEDPLVCAIREVYEETGYDIEAAGLVPEDRNVKYIEITMREQSIRLYVLRNVPMDTHFEPRTRKEISKIDWWPLSELPAFRKKGQQEQVPAARDNKFYNVAPFLPRLRKWIIEQKKSDARQGAKPQHLTAGLSLDELQTEEEIDNGGSGLYANSPFVPSDLETDERSLRLQQAIFQMQQQPNEAPMPQQATDNGAALLSFLKSGPASNEQKPPQNAPPHTPLELTIGQAPMPQTPHHHHPRPQPFSSMPPPPVFPSQPQNDAFSYQLPGFQNARQPYPAPSYNSNQQHSQTVHQNPHSYQSQHLVHPQPLPPHVPRAVFTGGPVHAPMMPPPVQQHPVPNLMSTVSLTAGNPQFPGLHAPMVAPVQRQQPVQLTSHSLGLLNAFKSKAPAAGDVSVSNDLPLRRFVQEPVQPQPPQPQELPADASQVLPLPSLPRLELQHRGNPPVGLIPSMMTSRQPQSEAHKSTLLDLFKSPATPKAAPVNSATATALPVSATPSAIELSAVEPLSHNAASTSALLNDKRTPTHYTKDTAIPQMNPESNLPFRALTILSRPSELSDNEAPLRNGSAHKAQAKPNGKHHVPKASSKAPRGKSPEKPFQPQILKRPAESAKAMVPAPVARPNLPSFSPPSIVTNPGQTDEHKQTLLSLFSGSPSVPKPISRVPTDPTQQQTLNLAESISGRSRVGSLTSTKVQPRRGSQPAMSPNNQTFLLNLLGGLTK